MFLCPSTSTHPLAQNGLAVCQLVFCSPHETLLCSARPMKSRGAVASRSQPPVRWEDFVLLRIKNFNPVKDKNLPTPPQSILDYQEESVFQHYCRKSRRIPDLTKGYRLQTETLTNTGQKHKYVNTGRSHPAGMSLLILWSERGAECTCIQGQRLSEQTTAFP